VEVYGGEVLVSDAGNSRVQVFDLQGRWLRSFGKGLLKRPILMDISQGKLYVADYAL
jgi:DNA-binding beta-propeller fold protein YncE